MTKAGARGGTSHVIISYDSEIIQIRGNLSFKMSLAKHLASDKQ